MSDRHILLEAMLVLAVAEARRGPLAKPTQSDFNVVKRAVERAQAHPHFREHLLQSFGIDPPEPAVDAVVDAIPASKP